MMPTTERAHADPIPQSIPAERIASYQHALDTDGYVVIKGLIPPAAAAALRAEVMEIMDIIGLPVTSLRQTGEYLAGSRLDALVNSPSGRAIATSLLRGPAHL